MPCGADGLLSDAHDAAHVLVAHTHFIENEEEGVVGGLGLIFLLETAEGGEGQASAIKARNQVSEYPPLSKLAGCFYVPRYWLQKYELLPKHPNISQVFPLRRSAGTKQGDVTI